MKKTLLKIIAFQIISKTSNQYRKTHLFHERQTFFRLTLLLFQSSGLRVQKPSYYSCPWIFSMSCTAFKITR